MRHLMGLLSMRDLDERSSVVVPVTDPNLTSYYLFAVLVMIAGSLFVDLAAVEIDLTNQNCLNPS